MSEITLATLGVIVLLLTMIVRIVFVCISLRRFSTMFDGKIKEGTLLLKYLKIPGLEEFVKQELLFTILPYSALAIVLIFTPVSSIALNEMNLLLLIFSIMLLGVWVLMDFVRSYLINRKLESVRKETSALRSISGNVLDGMKYIVYIRGSASRTALALGKRAIVGVAKSKVKESTKSTKKKPFGIAALIALEQLISFPERVIGKLTDWAKDVIDEKLEVKFRKYSERSKITMLILTVWSLLPALWLAIIATYLY